MKITKHIKSERMGIVVEITTQDVTTHSAFDDNVEMVTQYLEQLRENGMELLKKLEHQSERKVP